MIENYLRDGVKFKPFLDKNLFSLFTTEKATPFDVSSPSLERCPDFRG